MATRTWLGLQASLAQSGTITVTAVDATPANNTFTITIGGVAVSVTGNTSTTQTATDLYTAVAACVAGQFTEITWTNPSAGVVKGVAKTAGQPFTAVASKTGAGTGTIGAYTAVQANVSPNDANDAANYSGSTLPTNNDTVVFDGTSSVPVYWNLGSLSAVTLAALRIDQSYTGQIGLKETNSFGTAYPEYRSTELAFDVAAGGGTLDIGKGTGNGCGLIKLVLGSTGIWTMKIYQTGSPSESGRKAVSLRGPTTNTILTVYAGSVDICPLVTGYASTVLVMTVLTSTIGNGGNGGPQVRFGTGATLTTVTNDNATVEINGAVTTLNHLGGTTNIIGTGAITTLNVSAGNVSGLGTGTITTLNLTNATFNVGDAGPALTITNCKLGAGAVYLDRGNRVTETNGIALQALARLTGTSGGNVVIDKGPQRTYTVT